MYEVFDNFLAIETWNSTHFCDQERFDQALTKIISKEDFIPSRMGDYFYDNVDETNQLNIDAIQRYVNRAETIKEFLDNTGK